MIGVTKCLVWDRGEVWWGEVGKCSGHFCACDSLGKNFFHKKIKIMIAESNFFLWSVFCCA